MPDDRLPLPAGAAQGGDDLFVGTWPGRPALYRLKDDLILQIPPEFQTFWAQKHWLTGASLVDRPPRDHAALKPVKNVQFALHLPDFGGYTPQNFRTDPHPDRVFVFEVSAATLDEMAPGAPGLYAPNVEARVLRAPPSVDPSTKRLMHGLDCYETAPDGRRWFCIGARNEQPNEYILLDVDIAGHPNAPFFPLMQALYFSPSFGGLHVGWRTHGRHVADWRVIDEQVWKRIRSWNVARRSKAMTSSKP